MSSQESSFHPLLYGSAGLLAGGSAMAFIQSLAKVKRLIDERERANQLDTTPAVFLHRPSKEEEKEETKKTANTTTKDGFDPVFGPIWLGMENAGRSLMGTLERNVAGPTAENVGNYGAFLAALLAGGWGANELYQATQKDDVEQKRKNVKEEYYRKLLEFHGKEPSDVSVGRLREKKANSGKDVKFQPSPLYRPRFTLFDALVASFVAGVPLSAAYLTKRYMDERMPGLKQPYADLGMHPELRVAPVVRTGQKPKEEKQDGKEEDEVVNVKKAAVQNVELDPEATRAFETSHLLNVIMANPEHASRTIFPKVLSTLAQSDLGEFKDYLRSQPISLTLQEMDNLDIPPLTDQEQALAIEVIAADSYLRNLFRPIAAAEIAEEYPVSVKTASSWDEGTGSLVMLCAAAAALEEEERRFRKFASFEPGTTPEQYAQLAYKRLQEYRANAKKETPL